MVKEVAFDPLALEDALAEGNQQLLLSVLLDYNVLVRPRISIRNRLAPRGAGNQRHDVDSMGVRMCDSISGAFLMGKFVRGLKDLAGRALDGRAPVVPLGGLLIGVGRPEHRLLVEGPPGQL